MSLRPADRAQLDLWWHECVAAPGRLPATVEPVQVRLIRAVGRGTLPSGGCAYLKVMAFPRPHDRLRYGLRALPAVHEARMLARATAAGLRCPAVLLSRGLRRWRLPVLSVLITRSLPVLAGGEVAAADVVAAAAALASAGIYHPDCNPGNFVALADGGVGVLDLQSARFRRRGVSRRERVAMTAKLLLDVPDALGVAVATGLVAPADRPAVEAAARALRNKTRLQRIMRCMRESTEFTVERRWNGRVFRRRDLPMGGTWHRGGPELVRYWLGDRVCSVMDGTPPRLGGLFRKSWWLPGRNSVYIPHSNRGAVLPTQASTLLEGFERYQAMKQESL